MNAEEYREHDGLGLAELVARGDASAGELLSAARERAAAVNPKVNAIVRPMDPEADARVAEGAALSGPFAGVPFLIKDLAQDYAGLPTSWGSRSLAALPAAEHATVVQRWLDAGLVIFGKTNTPEFGAKGITESELFGPARNPWDLSRTPGGSSGGAAAAVAAGIVPVAGASDGGGSIRIPAGCCGLFGLKAGRGLIPAGPAVGEALHGSATDGVVSRSVRDSAAMLDVLAGPGPAAPYDSPRPATPFLDEVGRDPGRLRIGVRVESVLTPDPHPEARAAVAAAVECLEELGHEVVELAAAPYDDAALAREFLVTWFVHLAWAIEDIKRRTGCGNDSFELETLIAAALGRTYSSTDYCAALEHRQDHVRRLDEFHQSHDLLLTPTLATAAPDRRVRPPGAGAARRPGGTGDQDHPHPPAPRHRRPDRRRQPRLGAVHPAREPDRAAGGERTAALDGGRAAAGRAVRGGPGRRAGAAAVGGAAGGGAAVGGAARYGLIRR